MKKRMVMRRNVSLTPLPLSKGRGECMPLLGVSIFMWWLLGDMLLPLSLRKGECILLLGVFVFMWLLVGICLYKSGVLLVLTMLIRGNYAPWRGECVFLLGVSVFMWLLGVSLFVQDVVFYVVDDCL